MLTLSVISPVYNGENHIVAFLEGVAAQTWRDFEFITVDDGSTDRTAQLIEAYLPRLGRRATFIRHEKNMGEGAAIATAFSKVTGDICLKMDSDSLIEPDTFAKIMESFAADEQVGIVTVLFVPMERSNWVLRAAEVTWVAQRKNDVEHAQDFSFGSGACLAFRRPIFSIEDLASRTDVDLGWMARKNGWKIVLREDLTIRTRFPATLSQTFSRGRRTARHAVLTYWHHKDKLLTRWGFWVKFTPLGLALTALFKPVWALAGLLGWLGALQIYLARRTPEYPFTDRLSAWVLAVVRWVGFDIGVVLMAAQAVVNRLTSGRRS